MSAQEKLIYTPEIYLELEREATERSEFVNGDVFMMAGASRKHNTLSTNLVIELGTQFKNRDCQVYSSDMRVNLEENYVYPDVMVACEPQQFDDESLDNLLNPVLIVEVLSKSTESYDRGDKFLMYRRLPSLLHYVLVCQKRLQVEHYQRQENNQWLLTVLNQSSDYLVIESLAVRVKLEDIYAKVDLGDSTATEDQFEKVQGFQRVKRE